MLKTIRILGYTLFYTITIEGHKKTLDCDIYHNDIFIENFKITNNYLNENNFQTLENGLYRILQKTNYNNIQDISEPLARIVSNLI